MTIKGFKRETFANTALVIMVIKAAFNGLQIAFLFKFLNILFFSKPSNQVSMIINSTTIFFSDR